MTDIILSIVRLAVPLALYTVLTLGISCLVKRSFGKTLPVVMCGAGLLLYISQYILGSFTPGMLLIYVLAALSLGVLIFSKIKGKETGGVFSPGLIALVVMYTAACFTLLGKSFLDWDEYTHWGIMVKESLRLDRFYCVPESRQLWHKDYPPMTCLNEFIFAKIMGYSESHVTIGMQVFTLSFLVPDLTERISGEKTVRKENIIRLILCSFSVLVTVLMLEYSLDLWDQKIINSILPDVLLSFMFCFLFIKALEWDGKDVLSLVSFAVVSAALSLTKQVGIAFIMVALLMLIFKQSIVLKEQKKGERRTLRYALYDASLLAVPLIFISSWNRYKSRFISDDDYSYMNGQFNLRQVDPGEYIRAVTGRAEGILDDTFKDYVHALFSKKINNAPAIPLTYFSAFLLCIIILVTAAVFLRKMEKKTAVFVGISFFTGTCGYAFMMSILYLFCFPDNEKEVLAGYTRYMDSYILGQFLVLFAILLPLLLKGIKGQKVTAALITIALASSVLLNSMNIPDLLSQRNVSNPYSMYRNYAGEIQANVPPDSKVFIVYDKEISTHPQWWSPMQLFVQYYVNEVDICENYPGSFAANYSKESTKTAITSTMAENDYLYVINTCDNFNDGLREYNGGEDFEENCFYRIISNGNTLEGFQKVG